MTLEGPVCGRNPEVKQVLVVILDMAAVVHYHTANVFGEYTVMHLLPFMENQMNTCTTRVDAVWDCYPHGNLNNKNTSETSW